MTRPAVTIVIPVWNAAQTTSNCLSVLRRTLRSDDQVVVVDNGSRDETPRLLAQHDWIEVVTHEENKGFAGGCNAGARQARNPIVVFLNNDTVPAPGWIEGLVAPFADSEVGATGPVSNMAAGYQYREDDGYRPKTVAEIVRYTDEVRRTAAGRRREVDLLIGFCLAVRTSVFTEIGGFDESFGIGGCEDNDLSNRLRFAGWKLIVAQDTFVHHFGHQTFDANQLDWLAIEGDNEAKLERKLDAYVPVSFVVLCGNEPVPLIATLVGIQQTMGTASYEVVLLVPDREPLAEVLDGVGGVTVVDVPGLAEDQAWQLGHHRATGLRRAMLRAGEAVDVAAVERLVGTDPLRARPTAVGTEMQAAETAAGATRPRVSIIIPVFNRADLTLQCLTSLAEHTGDEVPYEVIIVDNASTDGTADVLAALEGDVTILRNDENRGFGEACNQGAAVAAGEYVLFLNNDTMMTPGWLPPLVAALDEEPRRAAVQPKLLYPDGTLNDAGGLVFANGDAWVYGKGSPFPDAPAYSVRRAPDYASGACLLVRKRAFDEIGGFDSRYAPAYYEDTDLSFAFRAAGWTVLYEPASRVVHLEGGTAGTDVTKGLKVYQVRNKDRFTEKWAAELATRPAVDPAIVEAWAHRSQGGFGPGEEVALDALTGSRDSAWVAARTRAQTRRHVLVIDVFTPMYDRASGHLRAFQLVRSLRAAGHTVTYFAAALCIERARYATALSRIGVALYGRDPEEVELADQLPPDLHSLWSQLYSPTVEALAHRHAIDTVLFTPWVTGEQVGPIIRRVLPDAMVVVDSCDLHFVREEREAQLTGDLKAIAKAAEHKRRELAVYGEADAVVVVSDKEAEVLSAELPDARIAVIGNAHDEKPLGPGFAERSGVLFVGNANHSPNVDAVTWWAEEIAPRLAELLPGVPLTVVGNDPNGEFAALRTANVDVVGWVPDTLPYLHRARVSVAPLRYGAGVKGKVGEALAAGLPVVGTTIAVEGMGLRDEEHVLVADDPETFARQVARLYTDVELWEKLRAAGPEHLSGTGGLKDMADAAADLLADPEHAQWTAVPARWSSPLYRPEAPATPVAPAAAVPTLVAPAAAVPTAAAPAVTGELPRISVVLNVRNEAKHLADCLASVQGADDLVVADMESDDDTVAIAEAAGARILRLPNAGYCEPGRQPAIDAAAEEWVLLIDADERLSGGGLEKLRVLAASARPDVSAYLLPEPTYLGSRLINATGWEVAYERHPRFFRKSHVTWPAEVHGTPQFEADVVDLPDGVDVSLTHLAFDSLEHLIDRVNRYTSAEADERRAASLESTPAKAMRDAVAEFTRRYSPEEDGSLSLALSMGMFMYRFLTHVKTIERFGWSADGVPGKESMERAWHAVLETLGTAEREQARAAAAKEYDDGRPDAAVARLRDAMVQWGEDAATLSDLAVIETARGDFTAASDAVDAALALDPRHVDARVNRFCLDLFMGHRSAPTRVAIDWPTPLPPEILALGSTPDGNALPALLGDLPLDRGTLEFVLVGSESLAARPLDAGDVLAQAVQFLAPGGRIVIGSPSPAPALAEQFAAQLRALGLDVVDDQLGLVGVHPGGGAPTAAPPAPVAPAVSQSAPVTAPSAPSGPLVLPTAPNGKVRVNLACGDDRRPGWLNVDAHTPADLNMDLLDMRFEDASVDEILLSHALEHFSESQFRRVLKECRRVLRDGGRLLVNVPDLEWVIRNWLALPEQHRWDWALATVFGLQDNPGEFHRTGFSVRRLEAVLLEAGFAEARVSQIFSHGQGCLWAEAYATEGATQPPVSALISPNTGEGLEAVLDELQRILPEGADLVVSERLGTAGPVLARTTLPVTWLHNVDGITEEDGLAQAASLARAELVLPVRFGRMPKQSDIVARAKVAKRPKPTGLIPAAVRDWKIYTA